MGAGEFELVAVALHPREVEWLDMVRGRVSREDYLAGLVGDKCPPEFRVTTG